MRKPKKKLKLKTNRAAVKRFKLTATGKIKRHQAMKRHILTKKNAKRKRRLRLPAILSHVEEKRVKQLMPYAGKY